MCAPKIWLTGSTFTWVHNLFNIVDFEFPSMGSPMLGDPVAHSFLQTFLFLSQSHSLLLWFSLSFLSVFSPELLTPRFSFSSFIYSIR